MPWLISFLLSHLVEAAALVAIIDQSESAYLHAREIVKQHEKVEVRPIMPTPKIEERIVPSSGPQ